MAERLDSPEVFAAGRVSRRAFMAAILGPTGLFIADLTKHEPTLEIEDGQPDRLVCRCGGWTSEDGRSYFDHLLDHD